MGREDHAPARVGGEDAALTWQPPAADGGSPILGYRIYRSTASGTETFLAEVGNVGTYADTNLTNGTTYYYEVAARNSVGEGSLSSEVSATPSATTTTTPSAPQNLTATQARPRGVALSWQPPSSTGGAPITNYLVYRGNAGGSETLVATLGNVTSYKDTSATSGQTFYYYVTAKNSAGEGTHSTEVSAVAR